MTEYRHEYKYRIDARQRAVLRLRAQGILERDVHAGTDGAVSYTHLTLPTICSV